MTKYSVVVPVYNSEMSLEELFIRTRDLFSARNEEFEMLFVDDGSVDGSWEAITRLKTGNPGIVTGIRLGRNYGQHNSTFCGLNFAKGGRVITIDDDLQVQPEDISVLIQKMEETSADVVYGIYRDKKHSVLRNMGSRSLKESSRLLHDSPGEGSSFRLISGELVHKILHHQQDFIFLDEILTWYTREIEFTEVGHLPRKYKESGYSFSRLVRMMADILLYYTMIPLKLLVFGGFFASLVSFIFGAWFIYKKLVHNVPLGYTSLIVTILFSTSIILFSLGVIGEYLRRIYQVQNKKPPYSIRNIL